MGIKRVIRWIGPYVRRTAYIREHSGRYFAFLSRPLRRPRAMRTQYTGTEPHAYITSEGLSHCIGEVYPVSHPATYGFRTVDAAVSAAERYVDPDDITHIDTDRP